jgi:hypothetical protein
LILKCDWYNMMAMDKTAMDGLSMGRGWLIDWRLTACWWAVRLWVMQRAMAWQWTDEQCDGDGRQRDGYGQLDSNAMTMEQMDGDGWLYGNNDWRHSNGWLGNVWCVGDGRLEGATR